jgi:hypothetical protein
MRLDRLLRLQQVEAPIISKQSAHERSNVVSPTHRPALPPQEIFLVLVSVRGGVAQGRGVAGRIKSTENSNDPIGI